MVRRMIHNLGLENLAGIKFGGLLHLTMYKKIWQVLIFILYNHMMYELACVMSRHAHAKLQMDIRHKCVSESSPRSISCRTSH